MNKAIHQIIIFLLFLSAGSVYINVLGGGIFFLSILGLSFVSVLANPNFEPANFRSFLIATTTTIAIIGINWLLTGLNSADPIYPKMIFRFFVVNFALFALINARNFRFGINSFELSFKIITIHAFISFLLGFFVENIIIIIPSEDLVIKTFLYVFFYISTFDAAGITIFRSQGLFWEPGVLATLLNIYFFLILFKYKTGLFFKLLVPFLIITTFSTTGMVIMGLIMLTYFITSQFTLKNIALLTIATLLLSPIVISNITNKVSGEGELSYLSRNYDALVAIDIIKSNPLKGIGLSREAYFKEQEKYPIFMESELDESRGNSNSILTTFVGLGIPLALVIFIAFYRQNLIQMKKPFFFFIVLLLLSSEPLMLSGFILLFICTSFYRKEVFA